MAQEKLDLFQFASGLVAESRAGPAQIVGCHGRKTAALGICLHDLPDDFWRKAVAPSSSCLIIDDLGMRQLPITAAEELLEIIMRRYERASTLLTSKRPVEDWGKLLGDAAAVSAMLDRPLHHGHVLKRGPRSWRHKNDLPPQEAAG